VTWLQFSLSPVLIPVELNSTYPGSWSSGTPIKWKLVIRNSNYLEAGYTELQLSGSWLSGTPINWKLVIRNSNYLEAGYPELQLP
jgi:hypothetical protein